MTTTDDLLARTLREEAGPLVARLSRRFGDFDLAEEAVQGAVVEALAAWRRDGPPRPTRRLAPGRGLPQRDGRDAAPRPAAGLAARADVRPRRRRRRLRRGTDDRLALLFACCHPALAPRPGSRSPSGPSSASPRRRSRARSSCTRSTLAQRIVRAKRKIVSARISLAVPAESELGERLGDVLAVVYVMFNEGFVSSTGATQDRDLAADAVWLAGRRRHCAAPRGRGLGLAALLTIQHARSRARFADGDLVLLRDQDRGLWDAAAIAEGERLIERAASLRRPGRTSSRPRSPRCTRPARAGTDGLAADHAPLRRAGPLRPLARASASTGSSPRPRYSDRPTR